MDNPWTQLEHHDEQWVLSGDRSAITALNAKRRNEDQQVVLTSLPEPFIGSPDSARVVLLNLNPRHDKSDFEHHREEEFRDAIYKNLRHELLEYPFYPLNPKFEQTGAAKWWLKILGPLLEEQGVIRKTIAERLMVVEWFPYHSNNAGFPETQICRSQEYSFSLVKRKLLETNTVVIGMRSDGHWTSAVPELSQRAEFLRNKQRPWISAGNMSPFTYKQILEAVR